MAARCGVPQRTLSRLKYEEGSGLSDTTLATMVEHVSGDTDEQARFLACYLRDRIKGPLDVRERIRILVDESPVLHDEPDHYIPNDILALSHRVARKSTANPHVLKILRALAEL